MKKISAIFLTFLCIFAVTGMAHAVPSFIAGTWSDSAIHILDENMNDLSSFSVGAGAIRPNGVASDGNLIFSGHYSSREVIAYDYFGVEQYRWSSNLLGNLQGMEIVGGELAVANSGSINFFDPTTGAFIRSFTDAGSGIEGLTYDGTYLWQLANSSIYATNPNTGATIRTIGNAAENNAFDGTGIAVSGLGELMLAATNGDWYRVSDVDGSLIASGNNGLNMFGLSAIDAEQPVPEPSTILLLGFGLAGLAGVARRKMKK